MKTRTLLLALVVLPLLPATVAAEEVFNYTYFDATYLDSGRDGAITAVEGRDTIRVNVGEGDGIRIRMSLALNSNVHVFAGYTGSNMDLRATQTVPYPTLGEMREAFLSTEVHSTWNERCDLNSDGMVNFEDLYVLYHADGDARVAADVPVAGDLTSWRLGVGFNEMLRPNVGVYARLFLDLSDLDHGSAAFLGGPRDFGANANGIGATVGLRGKVTDRLGLEGRVTYTPVGDVNLLGATDHARLGDQTLLAIGGEFRVTDTISLFAEAEGDGDVRAWAIGARTVFGS